MARHRDAVCRLCRREGQKLFLKGLRCFTEKCAIEKRNFVPGQHGQSRRPKVAGYGLQLREKQKVKRTYGLLERQFRNYFEKAERAKGPTGENLIIMLERRLDNVVWRAGLASSRSQARQLVLHGHVRVNGKKVNIPSYLVNVGEEVAIKEKMHQNAMVLEARNVAQSQSAVPWLEQEREQFKAKVARPAPASPADRAGDWIWARKLGPEGRNTMWKGFQKPKRLASELESLTEKYGRFSAQPFERGWGTTVGNALRRALLSSIEGAAITAVKIEGVLHEFSSIPGVVEDATDIILNLKQVPIKLNTDLPKTIYVNVEQAGPVTSAQIEEDADFAVLDKSVYIATVSEGGKLQIEMRAKNGRGYVAADRNYDEDLPIGYIPVDSVHSPVRKVNYSVEAARLGQMTDYEKLMIEVWTNGAITPQDSIGLAAKLVKDHMSIFINFEEPVDTVETPQDIIHDPRLEHLDRSVEELELSVRSYNCLKNANIQTIRELVQKSENEMLKTKNFGRKSLNEIKDILVKMGLALGMKFDEHGRIIWPPLPSQTAAPASEDTVEL